MQGEIKVEIEGDLMVVSLHGTSYRAIYFKSPLEPKLIQAPNLTVDKEGSMTHEEFEAMAWKAATARRASCAGLFESDTHSAGMGPLASPGA
jgi:hypothetical protein